MIISFIIFDEFEHLELLSLAEKQHVKNIIDFNYNKQIFKKYQICQTEETSAITGMNKSFTQYRKLACFPKNK